MYKRLEVEDSVRIPPEELGSDLKESINQALKKTVEGKIYEKTGIILGIEEVNNVEGGDIKPEDAGVHYKVNYTAITYDPELHEVLNGEVVDITDFGAFIRIGAIDGLCHVSQIMDDYVNLDEENEMLVSDEQNKSLSIGDTVTTRIIAVSLEKQDTNKINLTLRQPGLGKQEWIEEYEEEQMNPEEAEGEEE